MKNYAVTIGIPVYNVEKYIRLTMDSALAQTFNDIEFLVIDDCGTDSSIDIVREYQQTHPRGNDIRIIRQPGNRGIGNARNRIIDETRSPYLFFLDADDKVKTSAIELLYDVLKQHDAQIAFGSYERIEDYGGEIRKSTYQYPQLSFEKEETFATWAYRQYNGIQATTWNCLISVELLRKHQLRYKEINYWEDFIFMMDLPTYITRAVLVSDITYTYYCHTNSLSRFQSRDCIAKSEIEETISAIENVKSHSDRIMTKDYFPQRMLKVMMTDFYIICTILRNHKVITPPFSNRELRDIMRSPLSLMTILSFKTSLIKNLVLYVLGILPPSMSVVVIKLLGRKYIQ